MLQSYETNNTRINVVVPEEIKTEAIQCIMEYLDQNTLQPINQYINNRMNQPLERDFYRLANANQWHTPFGWHHTTCWKNATSGASTCRMSKPSRDCLKTQCQQIEWVDQKKKKKAGKWSSKDNPETRVDIPTNTNPRKMIRSRDKRTVVVELG